MNEQHKALRFRNELKFICNAQALMVLRHRIEPIAQRDRHAGPDGKYSISSLYFDDDRNSCCVDNDLGIGVRSKYRIRRYNEDSRILKLEQKSKQADKCAKRTCLITERQYRLLCEGRVSDLLHEDIAPVLRHMALLIQTQGFRPKAIVGYERRAYTAHAGNVRITIDMNCKVSGQLDSFLDGGGIHYPIQPRGMHLLEVKFDEFLPDHIRQALQMNTLRQMPFSKYYMGRQVLQRYWR